jgi:hypothetical protein
MMEVDYAVAKMVKALRKRRPYIAFPAWPSWQLSILRWLPSGLSDWLVRLKFKQLLARNEKQKQKSLLDPH